MVSTSPDAVTNHCQKESKLWVHVYNITISENELRFALLLASQHNGYLLSCH